MSSPRPAFSAAALLAAAAALVIPLGCSTAESPATTGAGGGPEAICAHAAGVEPYAPGLAATSSDGAVKITFVDADPTPPAKGTNTFTFKVTDASGHPMSGASLSLASFMPLHGHGSSTIPTLHAGSEPGEYVFDLVYLMMPGIWQETFTVQKSPNAPEKSEVVFTFCVDG